MRRHSSPLVWFTIFMSPDWNEEKEGVGGGGGGVGRREGGREVERGRKEGGGTGGMKRGASMGEKH